MRICFSRHGESHANILHEISNCGLKHSLTRKGREQANTLAIKLQQHSIKHIYSSPVLRALETSMVVAHRLGLDYDVVEALREYDCGILEGRADEVAWRRWKALFDDWVVHQHWEQCIEGGESFYDVKERFVPFIEGLIYQYQGTNKEILCMGHGGLYWMMLPLVLVNVDHALVAQYGFDYITCIVAELRPEGLICLEWNGVKI